MKLKNLQEEIQRLIEEDPENLNLEVQVQVEYDKYHDYSGCGVGYMSHHSFIVEEFYENPLDWVKEMGSDCNSIEDYVKEEEPSMTKVFYIKSTS